MSGGMLAGRLRFDNRWSECNSIGLASEWSWRGSNPRPVGFRGLGPTMAAPSFSPSSLYVEAAGFSFGAGTLYPSRKRETHFGLDSGALRTYVRPTTQWRFGRGWAGCYLEIATLEGKWGAR